MLFARARFLLVMRLSFTLQSGTAQSTRCMAVASLCLTLPAPGRDPSGFRARLVALAAAHARSQQQT